MLNNLELKFKYRSDHDSLFNDFYRPCLENSIRYDRAAGYFTSNSLKLLARGLDKFLHKSGKIRVVANPVLSQEDIEAIDKGYRAKEEVIENSLINELELSYQSIEKDTLNVLSWLIYNEQLDIKIAYLKNNGIYHEKFGIFYDENEDAVAFSGSLNETFSGLTSNFEKIDVYTSEREQHRVEDSILDFERLWADNTENLVVIDLPDSIKNRLIESRSKQYPIQDSTEEKIVLREYQKEAIKAWEESSYEGIFEMATGTGKTYTSLKAAESLLIQNDKLLTVVIVPFQHLVDQWSIDIKEILGENILKCYGSKKEWIQDAQRVIQDYSIDIIDSYTIVTTYSTAQSQQFKSLFKKYVGKMLLIADECHKLTINGFSDFPFTTFTAKLGLSATPDRWWDDDGTQFIKDALGSVVFSYELKEAIENDMLTPYKYFPKVVGLDESEMFQFNEYTKKIIRLYKREDAESKERLALWARKRSLIIAKAQNKIPLFLNQIKSENLDELNHTLVYCAEGQTNMITKELNALGLKVSKFNSTLSKNDRQTILKMFEEEKIQILVAMKCLDEGVDIPSTRKAFFLSSTANPREFVQRRGRILRKFQDKPYAEIYDYITLPIEAEYEDFRNVATKELPRFAEFSDDALNSSESRNIINDYLVQYNLSHLMYMKPWDIYHKNKER